MSKYLVSMPFKIGDTLWAMPTVQALARKWGEPVDFATAVYSKPIVSLLEYQSYIDKVIVDERFDNAILNKDAMWNSPDVTFPEEEYEEQVHLYYPGLPQVHLPYSLAALADVKIEAPLSIQYPGMPALSISVDKPFEKYIVVNKTRAGTSLVNGITGYAFDLFVKNSPVPVVLVGGPNDRVSSAGSTSEVLDFCGRDFLETSSVVAQADAFIGHFSGNATLASLVGARKQLLMVPQAFKQYVHIFRSLGDVTYYTIENFSSPEKMVSLILKEAVKDG